MQIFRGLLLSWLAFICYFCRPINYFVMKNLLKHILAGFFLAGAALSGAQSVVILHTNDTHSHIDAENGVGGVLQRKAIVDSVRRAEKNVLLVDAGDIVQGTLYYKLFGGEVEYPLMKLLGYDMQILGNHEFDNGIEALARYYKRDEPVKLSANYDVSGTALRGVLRPWVIKNVGGKKVGFFGINLDPDGIIDAGSARGVVYRDMVAAADSTAALLRRKGCVAVVAISHIGYSDDSGHDLVTDPKLASLTRGIDVIIGGHSHEVVAPGGDQPNVVMNAEGKPVLIAQTGRYGANLGYIKLDLADMSKVQARMIPVAGVDSSRFDRKVMDYLRPYAHVVDSINNHVIARCGVDMQNSKRYGTSVLLSNLTADIAAMYGGRVLDSIASEMLPGRLGVDLAIMNSGGIRLPFPKGDVTEGQVLSAFPFSNHLVIVEMRGDLLAELLEQVAGQGGQAVSAGTEISLDPATGKVRGMLVGGRPIDAGRNYYVATLDYLAGGGDYLSLFPRGRVVWRDEKEFCAPVMEYMSEMGRQGLALDPDPRSRIR